MRIEDVIENVDNSINGIIDKRNGIVLDEIEENSFKQIALSWEELPASSDSVQAGMRQREIQKQDLSNSFNFL